MTFVYAQLVYDLAMAGVEVGTLNFQHHDFFFLGHSDVDLLVGMVVA